MITEKLIPCTAFLQSTTKARRWGRARPFADFLAINMVLMIGIRKALPLVAVSAKCKTALEFHRGHFHPLIKSTYEYQNAVGNADRFPEPTVDEKKSKDDKIKDLLSALKLLRGPGPLFGGIADLAFLGKLLSILDCALAKKDMIKQHAALVGELEKHYTDLRKQLPGHAVYLATALALGKWKK